MLGTLARWLRLLGYDTVYPEASHDDEIATRVEREERVLLTRDRDLAARSRLSALYVVSDDLDAQIRQVLTELAPEVGEPMSRCSVCNGVLTEASRETARQAVPAGVWERHERFWRCPSCGRHYWRGTHWERMRPRIEEYTSLVAQARERAPSKA